MTPSRLLGTALDLAAGAAAVRTAGELDRVVWPRLALLVGAESLAATGFGGCRLWWPPGSVETRGGYEVVIAVGRAGADARVALRRTDRAFTDRDLALLGLVRPHLGEALWRAAHGTPPRRLTAREQLVVALVARGATDVAIAHDLGISRRTVSKHLENAYAALGVHDRTSAALLLEEASR
ncbi:response regulator transcription factor [Actinomycetospora chibensis]|uniref:Response regulator transcription factor n=1 Tax=Actinomycetospora chibensis TaxID=663606 RepID=A0ABV9RPL2_9PSEU|nr:helix-turn-helix transcriptional regulator [Actinomycetospora chibensis]MDD7924854.1 helix-turn-helix transcriptional regulator [Actinomycetospora chibensis]